MQNFKQNARVQGLHFWPFKNTHPTKHTTFSKLDEFEHDHISLLDHYQFCQSNREGKTPHKIDINWALQLKL